MLSRITCILSNSTGILVCTVIDTYTYSKQYGRLKIILPLPRALGLASQQKIHTHTHTHTRENKKKQKKETFSLSASLCEHTRLREHLPQVFYDQSLQKRWEGETGNVGTAPCKTSGHLVEETNVEWTSTTQWFAWGGINVTSYLHIQKKY